MTCLSQNCLSQKCLGLVLSQNFLSLDILSQNCHSGYLEPAHLEPPLFEPGYLEPKVSVTRSPDHQVIASPGLGKISVMKFMMKLLVKYVQNAIRLRIYENAMMKILMKL